MVGINQFVKVENNEMRGILCRYGIPESAERIYLPAGYYQLLAIDAQMGSAWLGWEQSSKHVYIVEMKEVWHKQGFTIDEHKRDKQGNQIFKPA